MFTSKLLNKMSKLNPPSNCVFIRVCKKRPNDEMLENESKKILIEQENGEITESESFIFDEDDLIVYSPEGSYNELIDESYQEPEQDPVQLFLQKENCSITSLELPQCRECSKDLICDKYSCRFYEFRKIEKSPDGSFRVAGFLDPHIDPSLDDLDLWTTSHTSLDRDSTNYILRFVASQFCEMITEELEVMKEYQEKSLNEPLIVWKRAVIQVREICDVCSTTLFNLQWTCSLCGTSICIDCYKERKGNYVRLKPTTKSEKEERDKFYWLKCHDDQEHQLILTQMIPGDSIQFLQENVHKLCDENRISMQCVCRNNSIKMKTFEDLRLNVKNILVLQDIVKKKRMLLKPYLSSLAPIPQIQLYRRVSHHWISKSQIIKFNEPSETEESYRIFQDQFQRGKPIVVANVTKKMRNFIWTPEYFLMRFGNKKHTLVNCQNDTQIHRVRMKCFWEGFESIAKRLPEESEKKMVLKLKDWPTSTDFADIMKDHFNDLMKAVPFAAYTTRDGKYNLAKYLHNHFCSPDLGPKMYSAYGQELSPAKAGSTNLHLDVSDAINVLAYVSCPKDHHLAPNQYSTEVVKRAMEQCDCDVEDIETFLNGEKLPGAIWFIYPATSADSIRKVISQEAKDRGKPLNENDDPLHNQDCFIDNNLKEKLARNGIVGYTIVQWEGDAIFVPAGAPHQVLNIFDCVKVALDFVSPENIIECFNLTSEFRKLSSRHVNREDKLQIKNILYHVIKSLVPSKSEYDL